MPFPRAFLDCYVVFQPSVVVMKQLTLIGVEHQNILRNLCKEWTEQGWITEEYVPTETGIGRFGLGSFKRLEVIHSDELQLFANHQGGYRVFCNHCQENITDGFVSQLREWRRRSERKVDFQLQCAHCMQATSSMNIFAKPAIAFGQLSLRFVNVENAELDEGLQQSLLQKIGEFKIVFKRVG